MAVNNTDITDLPVDASEEEEIEETTSTKKKHVSIYACPYCGAKSFNPITKAFAGGLNTKGRVCKACGRHCVNGLASSIFSSILYILALIWVVLTFLFEEDLATDALFILGAIAIAYVGSRIFDAFFGHLVPVARNDASSKGI